MNDMLKLWPVRPSAVYCSKKASMNDMLKPAGQLLKRDLLHHRRGCCPARNPSLTPIPRNVLVIGAAGRTGKAVVAQAVAAGHQVTAFVHQAGDYAAPNVRVIVGDATDSAAVAAAVAGQDAVLDTIGGKTPYQTTTLEASAAHTIVAAMRQLVVISMLGEGDSMANAPFYGPLLMATFLRGDSKDKAAMESAVVGSDLDWVILRPGILTDDPAQGQVRVFEVATGETAHKITRAGLAAFMVAQLTSDTYLHQAVTIANS